MCYFLTILFYLLDFASPQNVKTTIETSDSVTVTWNEAFGKVTGYQITYCDIDEPTVNLKEVVGHKDRSCLVKQLVPGKTYNFTVCSLSGKLESDEMPLDGLRLTMRKVSVITAYGSI